MGRLRINKGQLFCAGSPTAKSIPQAARQFFAAARQSCFTTPGSGLAAGVLARIYSAMISPEPPKSAGKSFSFGRPSRMGSTVSA